MTTLEQASHDLNKALTDALINTLYAMDPLFRPHCHWVMNPDWLAVLKAAHDPRGDTYWEKRATHLYGLPFTVADDGGAPHLVMEGPQ